MRKLRLVAAMLAAVLSLTLTAVVPLQPAAAGDGYWSQTNCTAYNGWPWARLDIWWLSTSSGIWYWLDGWSESQGAHIVQNVGGALPGPFLNYYAAGGYQCNWPGAPLRNLVQCTGYPFPVVYQGQDFEGGVFFQTIDGVMHNSPGTHDPCHPPGY